MPYSGSRTPEEQQYHDQVVLIIAKTYFRHYGHTTYTNLGEEKNMAAGAVGGKELYPDIVVIDDFTGKPSVIAEVETESTVNENELLQWSDFLALKINFYLYVPTPSVESAIGVIDAEDLRHDIRSLRRYTLVDGKVQLNKIW